MRYGTFGILILFLLVIFTNVWVFPNVAQSFGALSILTKLPDLKFYYDPGELCLLFEGWSYNERQAYKWILFVDMFYPVVYASLIYLILKKFYHKAHRPILFLLPWIAAMFDWGENLSIGYWLFRFPVCPEKWMVFIPLMTSLKWIFLMISFLWIIFGLIKSMKNSLFKL